MERGEVWLTDQPPPIGRRSVLLIARSSSYDQRDLVTAAMVTTRPRSLRAEVELGPAEGLNRPSVANMETLSTIPKRQFIRRIGSLSPTRMGEVDAALRWAFDLD